MKKIVFLSLVVTLLCLSPPTVVMASVPIWSDGFEASSLLPTWDRADAPWKSLASAQAASVGSRGGDLQGPTTTEGARLAKTVSLAGYQDAQVQFDFFVRGALESGDHFMVCSTVAAGATEVVVADYSAVPVSTAWQTITLDLPVSLANDPTVQIIFCGIFDGTTDRVAIDQVIVSATPVPEPSLVWLAVTGLTILVRKR